MSNHKEPHSLCSRLLWATIVKQIGPASLSYNRLKARTSSISALNTFDNFYKPHKIVSFVKLTKLLKVVKLKKREDIASIPHRFQDYCLYPQHEI